MKFRFESGNWVAYRKLPDLVEIDFHRSNEAPNGGYDDNMQRVYDGALDGLIKAQRDGKKYVLFTHGSSTSHQGKMTSRSQVRKLMRSKEATPYLIRREGIQNISVFVAAIRPLPPGNTTIGENTECQGGKDVSLPPVSSP